MTTHKSIDAAKQAMRSDMEGVRSALSAAEREAGADALAHEGIAFAAPSAHAVISGYAAIGDELSLWPLLETLAASGRPIALPVTVRKGAPLIFRQWEPGAVLRGGAFRVPIPGEDAAELEPEILLVPLLAFDREGFRLGYGAGFYDRTLSKLRARGRVTAIGIAFETQQIEAVPHNAYDEPLDWVLTPSGPVKVGPIRAEG
jgi:5-formyltetrahydrofolate cyclo-ligase